MFARIRLLVVLVLLVASSPCPLSAQYGDFTSVKELFVSKTQFPPSSFESPVAAGFCYGRGKLWCITQRGKLMVVDTSGNVSPVLRDTPADVAGWNNGAICYDGDTLWVTTSSGIIPIDTTGQQIGAIIPLDHLGEPFSGYRASGVEKAQDGFWVLQGIDNILYKVDRQGNLMRECPNAWFGNRASEVTLGWYDGYLVMNGGDPPPSDGRNLRRALTVDPAGGVVRGIWAFPDGSAYGGADYLRHLGFKTGAGFLWVMERTYGSNEGLRIRKLMAPAPAPFPPLPTTQWGDFTIASWSYAPRQGGLIEGIYGLGYRTDSSQLWFNAHIGSVNALRQIDTLYHGYVGRWAASYLQYLMPRDICFLDDTIWVVHYWPGSRTASILAVEMQPDGGIRETREIDGGLNQMDGIATDGFSFWVSGRTSAPSTSMPANEIKKIDRQGKILHHFTYADTYAFDYSDLAWHDSTLWAIVVEPGNEHATIHRIDPETGSVIAMYKTGWGCAVSNINGNLASDGEHLLVISIVDPERCSEHTISCFANSHERLLKIVPSETPVGVLPAPPLLISPAPNAEVLPISVILQWSESAGALRYNVDVAPDTTFTLMVYEDTSIITTYTTVGPLIGGTEFFWRVRAWNEYGCGAWSETRRFRTAGGNNVSLIQRETPAEFSLGQNFPNPFNPSTHIPFGIPQRAPVMLALYNAIGQEVLILVRNEMDPGWYDVELQAGQLPTGMYICRLQAGGFSRSIRIALIR